MVAEKSGGLASEYSMLNNVKFFKDIEIKSIAQQKIVTLYPQEKKPFDPSDW